MIKKDINKYSYISFDVFDTLIERKCVTPKMLFLEVGRDILGESKAENFVKIRQIAEKEAYHQFGAKTRLDDIYNCISGFDQENLEKLKKEEINLEISQCYPKKKIQRIYNYAVEKNKIILLISDMYLSKRIIHEMLEKCQYVTYDKLYVSNEWNADKRSGKLFNLVLKDNNISASQLLHIGDSIKADILGSKKANIKSIFIPKRKLIVRKIKDVL